MKNIFFLLFVVLSFSACGNKSVAPIEDVDSCVVEEGLDTISFDDEQEYARFIQSLKAAQTENEEYEDEEYEDDAYYNDEYDKYSPKDITVRTPSGNYVHLYSDGYGNTSGYDSNGNYYHGYSDGYGNTNGYDSNGNYYHSYSDGYGNTSGYDSNGNYYHSYSDGYGNTSGYDSNGNYYNGYSY